MADPSEVGKYGTIRLLKRREPYAVVAVYPIDDEHVSFGRDASCSVRLYYPEVSPLHCIIVFEERKAILQVLGGSGVIVDGCPVYPTKSAVLGSPPAVVTVPLPNGSIFEIHKKRFMFNYPPKALRPQLFTPATVRRKSIRMSLVQSAQVFSPAPSPHPRENLRILQSPLRLPSSESPVKLVDGDHPRVYEEGQDLVILEDVEPQLNGYPVGNMMSPAPMRLQTLPMIPQGPPRTPRRRSIPSLHRAVLIRSAQRTAYMRESQAQMEQRHAGNDHGPQFEQHDLEDEDAEGVEDDEDEEDEVVNSILAPDETEVGMENEEQTAEDMTIDTEENNGEMAQVGQQDITEALDEYNEVRTNEPQLTTPLQVSQALHLGGFSTPQPGLFSKRSEQDHNERRKTGPQRPPPGFRFSLAPGLERGSMVIKEEDMDEDEPSVPIRSTSPTKRQEITEEERKAILERRRSALKEPDPEIGKNVFGPGEKGTSTIPPPALAPASPFKTLSTHIEEGEDTQVVLQRMQVQVAERRASLSPTRPRISRGIGRGMLPPSPEKTFSLLASRPRLGNSMRTMPKLEEGMEEEQNLFESHESMDLDAGNNQIENDAMENDENTSPTRERSRTPRLDGLREMFRAPAAAMGLATPAVRGVRDLFRAPAIPQTPRMEGMRQLFAQQRAPETPALDGIKDMMHVDEQDQDVSGERVESSKGRDTPDVPEDVSDKPEATGTQPAARMRKLPLATRTLSRTKGSRPTLFRTRGTPTDTSTMADDEATPDFAASVDNSKRLDAPDGVPEAAVVHRMGRGRRGARTESDTEGSKTSSDKHTSLKSGEESGRKAEEKAVGIETDQEDKAPIIKPPSKSRSRRKADLAATASESETGGNSASQSSKRGSRAGSAQPEGGVIRRSTRARSRSAEPDNDDNVEGATKAGTQAVAAAVETIPEEEEPVSTRPKTVRKASAPSTSKTRRTRTRTESSADDAPPKKRAGRATSSAAARRTGKASAVESTEDATHVEDKENTPERSPISETGDDASSGPGKPASKARAGAKPPSKTKTSLGAAGGAKATSRTTKTKMAEGSTAAPRATRTTRARK